MPYRVRGYPYLQTARPQGTAAELEAGKIDVADVRPALLRALEWVGERLGHRLTIFSGYRTSAYSAKVGGFAGDPHSRGIAADISVNGTPVGDYPGAKRLLTAAGLISGAQPGFYRGRRDPAHVQLGGRGAAPPQTTLGSLWISAGGPPKLANLMAAIALAESGGRVDARGGPNQDGSYDYGLWQINSSHSQYNADRLMSEPLYNARAAVAVWHSQGLGAWTTYRSGAYRDYLQGASRRAVAGATARAPRTRPGGQPADSGAAASEAQLAAWYDYVNPTSGKFWDPLGVFSGAKNAVEDLGTFLKWIAWIFHPRNILRTVEFLSGAGLMTMGLVISVKIFGGHEQGGGGGSTLGSALGGAFGATAAGRAVGVRRAARHGRRQARFERTVSERQSARAKAKRSEETRLSNKAFEREGRKTQSEEIPF